MPLSPIPIILLGGRSLVAPYLMRRIHAAGLTASVVSRQKLELPEGFTLLSMDLTASRTWVVPEKAIVISLLPLWVLTQHLPHFIGAQSIIAVSSSSRFAKATSDDPKERMIADSLGLAEDILEAWCTRSNTAYTLLRPTMIYDGTNDQNVTRMAQFIKRFGFLPLAAPAHGLRQPIHADDVAAAIMGALGNARVYNRALNIAGGEVLTYRAMAERIFQALNRTPRFMMLPTPLLQRVFQLATKMKFLREKSFGFSVFKRMNEDLVFDSEEGLRLLSNYKPRGFEPDFKERVYSHSN